MSKPNNLSNKRLTAAFVRNVTKNPTTNDKAKRMTANPSLIGLRNKKQD